MNRPSLALAPAVTVHHVSKEYQIVARPRDRIKALLTPLGHWGTPFWAVRDADFVVPRGQVLGLIGPNGSGKSTLLQLITGVLQPTTGTVTTNGRITALLELGAGFHPEFTGRENILLNGLLLGLSQAEVRARLPAIVAFAEIGDFIDRPVKTYSSGMYVRLAFAVAANVEPDILVVDEALAVGDAYFQQRCMRRMHEFRAHGKTIVFVSHDTAAVRALCDRAILMHQGRIVDDGPADKVVMRYLHQFVLPPAVAGDGHAPALANAALDDHTRAGNAEHQIPHVDARYGSGAAHILGLACYNDRGEAVSELPVGEALTVRLSVRAARALAQPGIGVVLRDRLGLDLAGANTAAGGTALAPLPQGAILTVRFRLALPALQPGPYSISPSVTDGALAHYMVADWIENAAVVTITGPYPTGCIMQPPFTITVETPTSETSTPAVGTGTRAESGADW